MTDNWISVDDRLPPLVMADRSEIVWMAINGRVVQLGYYRPHIDTWFLLGGGKAWATYWQPAIAPGPPERAEVA